MIALALLLAAPATIEVPVLQNAVARGALLEAVDFGVDARTPAQARGALPVDKALGREALRNLPAGSIVRSTDIIAPRLVRRGEPVSVVVRTGALAIATPGKALGGGAAGDLVRVVILSTNRTLDGIVAGAGEVRVGAR